MIRKDTWSDEADVLLATTVLDHIRNGNTQLEAFEVVARRLDGRTPAACGFRWNNTLRKQYMAEIQEAKRERSNTVGIRKKKGKPEVETVQLPSTFKSEEKDTQLFEQFSVILNELRAEFIALKEENSSLRQRAAAINPQEDLQDLLKIIRKAYGNNLVQQLIEKEKPTG